jgi:DNA-binding CsgD family transcriptional regulator
MKKILIKASIIVLYLFALLWLVDFQFIILFNLKMIVIMTFGTTLLSLSSYKHAMTKQDIFYTVRWNIQITAYLTTFILQFALLSSSYNATTLLYDVAMNCRPLLYALFFIVFMQNFTDGITMTEINTNVQQIPDQKTYVNGRDFFKKCGLTDREIDVAQKISEDLSNKEIANQLFISENTVKKHTYNLFRKLNISNREQLKNLLDPQHSEGIGESASSSAK